VSHDFYATNAQVLVGLLIVMSITSRVDQSRNGTRGRFEAFSDHAQLGAVVAVVLDLYGVAGHNLHPVGDGVIWIATFSLLCSFAGETVMRSGHTKGWVERARTLVRKRETEPPVTHAQPELLHGPPRTPEEPQPRSPSPETRSHS
jgi:hypothetical protein